MSKSESNRFVKPDQYLAHFLGMNALMAWLYRWHKFDDGYHFLKIRGPLIQLSLVPSQRFAFARPKKKTIKPFMAIQKEEMRFMERLTWDRMWVDTVRQRLVLRTAKIVSDLEDKPEIPSILIEMEAADPAVMTWLATQKQLEMRQIWFHEEGYDIEDGPSRNRIKVEALHEKGTPWWEDKKSYHQGRSLEDIIRSRVGDFVDHEKWKVADLDSLTRPQFSGKSYEIPSDMQHLIKPFNPEEVAQVRPNAYSRATSSSAIDAKKSSG